MANVANSQYDEMLKCHVFVIEQMEHLMMDLMRNFNLEMKNQNDNRENMLI
jgi:hypothetical protein